MSKKIIILGTGGSSVDILDTLRDINAASAGEIYECIGFLDDQQEKQALEYHGVPVLGPLASAASFSDCFFVNGIGTPLNFIHKPQILAKTGIPSNRFESVVHPSAVVSSMATLGSGTVLFQNVVVTSNVQIGTHVIVLPNTVISHDDVIGDYTCIAGGVCVSGGVRIGENCYIGTNSSIIGNVAIGDRCVVGMGSVVLADVPANSVVAGNPARKIRETIAA